MQKEIKLGLVVILLAILLAMGVVIISKPTHDKPVQDDINEYLPEIDKPEVTRTFSDDFIDTLQLEEGNKEAVKNVDWWLNSGAYFFSSSGMGSTLQGELATSSKWRLDYLNYDALETDNGFHPQNIFRLVTRTQWLNINQQAYFKLNRYILSPSPNRRESNGFFLFNRYQDGDNLYYTGLRVDGAVSIKKKYKGVYYEMAYVPFIKNSGIWNRVTNPNLLPVNTWVGLKSEVLNNPDGSVQVNVYIDLNNSGQWVKAASARDDGKSYGGPVISNKGYAGIRTDFMDADFSRYRAEEIK